MATALQLAMLQHDRTAVWVDAGTFAVLLVLHVPHRVLLVVSHSMPTWPGPALPPSICLQLFEEFEPQPIAAASLGQVHVAKVRPKTCRVWRGWLPLLLWLWSAQLHVCSAGARPGAVPLHASALHVGSCTAPCGLSLRARVRRPAVKVQTDRIVV